MDRIMDGIMIEVIGLWWIMI